MCVCVCVCVCVYVCVCACVRASRLCAYCNVKPCKLVLNVFIFLFIQYFKRLTHFAVLAILPCGPLCKHTTYIQTLKLYNEN